MNKIIYIGFAVLLLPFFAFSQVTRERDITGSAGDYSTTPTLELAWTVGEVAVMTKQSGNLIINEGFQQSDQNPTGMTEGLFSGEIVVYPTPMTDLLNFRVRSDKNLELKGELYDLTGKRVMEIPAFQVYSEYTGQIDCSRLPSGKWLLRFSDSSQGVLEIFSVTKL